jgi:hypothetical protein
MQLLYLNIFEKLRLDNNNNDISMHEWPGALLVALLICELAGL